jgi:hypothetical protein
VGASAANRSPRSSVSLVYPVRSTKQIAGGCGMWPSIPSVSSAASTWCTECSVHAWIRCRRYTMTSVADIAAGPLVCYSVEERAAFAYLAIAADAAVVEDAVQRRAKWDRGLAAFFPGGPEGDDFVLLRLSAVRIELMNFAQCVHPDPYGLVPAVIERSVATWHSARATRQT